MTLKRDYKIVVEADNNDVCFFKSLVKGEEKAKLSLEDYETIASMLDEVSSRMKRKLTDIRHSENIPEMEILDKVEVKIDNIDYFYELFRQGIIETINVNATRSSSYVNLSLRNGMFPAEDRDFLIRDASNHWEVMKHPVYMRLQELGKIREIKRK